MQKSRIKRARRRVTIRDVARAAGASISTVSAALNDSDYVSDEMRKRVTRAISRLHYLPNDLARSLRMQRSHALAVVVPDLSNSFFTEIIRGMEDSAASLGYTLLIGDSRERWAEERKYLNAFSRRRVDGVARISAADDAGGQTETLLGNIPVVYVDRFPHSRDSCVSFIGVDNVSASYGATRYLLGLGHRRIAIITGFKTIRSSADRVEGYRRAMRSLHLPLRSDFIRYVSFEMASGARAATELITGHDRPTAIFCANNTLTFGALEAIQELGLRCPDEISLLGFDDIYWSSLVRPRLTMVRQPAREIGMTAARVLINHVERRSVASGEHLLPTQLVIRDSCAAPAPIKSRRRVSRRRLPAA